MSKHLGGIIDRLQINSIILVSAINSIDTVISIGINSLGTPPRLLILLLDLLSFQARLLHNQEDVNTDRYI